MRLWFLVLLMLWREENEMTKNRVWWCKGLERHRAIRVITLTVTCHGKTWSVLNDAKVSALCQKKLETKPNMREQLYNLLNVVYKQNPYHRSVCVVVAIKNKNLREISFFSFILSHVESVRMRLQWQCGKWVLLLTTAKPKYNTTECEASHKKGNWEVRAVLRACGVWTTVCHFVCYSECDERTK